MSVITTWITNIILLVLFATILELILPNSKMQRYVKLVVGLMLLMVMLQPLLSVFQMDPEELFVEISSWESDEYISETSSIDSKKMDIEMDNLAYISEYMAVQLKKQASNEVEKQFEVVLSEVMVEFSEYQEMYEHQSEEDLLDNLSGVYVLLESAETAKQENNDVQVVQIDPVKIGKELADEDLNSHDQNDKYSEIITFLSQLWVVPEEKIHVDMKGGEE